MTVLRDAAPGSLSRTRVYAGWLVAVAGTLTLTAGLVPFREGPSPTFEAMLYLALAVACALVGGRWPALGASALGAVALNFFFTEPVHTLTVASPLNVVSLVLFALVSVAVASVVDSAARRRTQATRARAEADTLAMLNRTVLGGQYAVPELLDLVRAPPSGRGPPIWSPATPPYRPGTAPPAPPARRCWSCGGSRCRRPGSGSSPPSPPTWACSVSVRNSPGRRPRRGSWRRATAPAPP